MQAWQIEANDGTHIAVVKTATASGETLDLFLDDILIESIPKKLGFSWNSFDFTCGDETLTLLHCGARMDIVHRGRLLHKNIPYSPDNTIPKWQSILFMGLYLSAIAACALLGILLKLSNMIPVLCFISLMASCCCALFTKLILPSPLISKKNTYRLCFSCYAYGQSG